MNSSTDFPFRLGGEKKNEKSCRTASEIHERDYSEFTFSIKFSSIQIGNWKILKPAKKHLLMISNPDSRKMFLRIKFKMLNRMKWKIRSCSRLRMVTDFACKNKPT